MFEISSRLSHTQHIAVEIILEEFGASSISLHDAADNPVFIEELDETPLWEQITLTALFKNEIDLNHLQNILENTLDSSIEITPRSIDEKDWQLTWAQGLQPMLFGERLWVCPSCCIAADPFAINIKLDPGLAFGTGTHPTTALCLEWLANHPPANKTLIDFGCGSGILAIAAYYLGAKTICAIDHDLQAIQATRENADRNHVPKNRFKIVLADDLSNAACDVLIANILLRPLIKLKKPLAEMTLPAGKLILSGILQHQLEELTQTYQSHFDIEQIYSKNEWLLVEATRR